MASAILDPKTGLTVEHTRLLLALQDFTTDSKILAAVLREGLYLSYGVAGKRVRYPLDDGGLMYLAQLVQATLEGRGGISEGVAGQFLLAFVSAPKVRRAIAAYVVRTHGVKPKHALRDLHRLKNDLEEKFGLRRAG